MRAWFIKFRISAARDSSRPLPSSVQAQAAGSEELRLFAARCSTLDRALANGPPRGVVPPSLHGSIMAAVRRSQGPALERSSRAAPLWLRVSAAVAAVLVVASWCGWFALKHSSPAMRPTAAAAQADPRRTAAGGVLPWPAPINAMAPLTEEMDSLDRDLDGTAKFLLACLPGTAQPTRE